MRATVEFVSEDVVEVVDAAVEEAEDLVSGRQGLKDVLEVGVAVEAGDIERTSAEENVEGLLDLVEVEVGLEGESREHLLEQLLEGGHGLAVLQVLGIQDSWSGSQ